MDSQQTVTAAAAVRRPKKRPSFGVRTIELTRGHLGFGFTLSGQGPCILSSIVDPSPASKANLKPGDHVIAVNGKNVAKSLHDDVVRLIGNSTGLLKLQIAENYCSSSDDEDWSQNLSDNEEYMIPPLAVVTAPLRPLHFRGNSADSTLTDASEVLPRPKRISPRKKVAAKIRPQKFDLHGGQELQLTERDINSFLHPTLNELRKSIKLQNRIGGHGIDLTEAVTKAVVGYLGTIEMPKENQVCSTLGGGEAAHNGLEKDLLSTFSLANV
jgi:hypothetical protein